MKFATPGMGRSRIIPGNTETPAFASDYIGNTVTETADSALDAPANNELETLV